MPFDTPQDRFDNNEGDDNDWADIPGYQPMNVVNDADNEEDEGDEDESDFDFSSDEEAEENGGQDVRATLVALRGLAEDIRENGYAQYMPMRVRRADDRVNGTTFAAPAVGTNGEADGEENAEANQARNQFYQHNYVVQWIETDQPLFPGTENAVPPENPTPVIADQQSFSEMASSSTSAEQPNSTSNKPMDREQIDVIKGLMSNFKLPEESVPGWAKEIPEEQWKSVINKKFDNKPT